MDEAQAQKKGYVLVVEDDQDNVDLIARTLRDDAKLWIATNLADAFQILTQNQVHVVVTDFRLPDGAGTTLLDHVARTMPDIGRVLVTAYDREEEVVAACREGVVQRFFLKPYVPRQLQTAVHELLRTHGVVDLPRVLVADDDSAIRLLIAEMLRMRGMAVTEAIDGADALEKMAQQTFDVALLDVTMPKMGGLAAFRRIVETDPELPVIFVTAVDGSVGINLLEEGAFDVVGKPLRRFELLMRVERAIIARRTTNARRKLFATTQYSGTGAIVAESDAMQAVLDQARVVAGHDVNVLITGETGSGKEVIARFVHQQSRRAAGPFIPVNCGAIPDTLIETELFGHERGAFTGAVARRAGFFEAADGGTIMLDEVGDLSPHAQVRLLRVLEQNEVTRIGASRPTSVDVRVLAATHRGLEEMVEGGTFRSDLFYRLSAYTIDVPPLCQRPADIMPLIQLAVSRFCAHNGLPIPDISTAAIEQACSLAWPGNVRELLQTVERTLITHGPARIDALDVRRSRKSASGPARLADEIDAALPLREALGGCLESLEKEYLVAALKLNQGHLGRTAKHAGIHRKSLYNKLKRYGITAEAAVSPGRTRSRSGSS